MKQTDKPKRVKKIDARFTEEEYKTIEALEKSMGMSKTDLVRRRLLSNGPFIAVNAKVLMEELNKIGAALGYAGNNINQLARHANYLTLAGKLDPVIADRFNSLLEVYLSQQKQLEIVLRKALRSLVDG